MLQATQNHGLLTPSSKSLEIWTSSTNFAACRFRPSPRLNAVTASTAGNQNWPTQQKVARLEGTKISVRDELSYEEKPVTLSSGKDDQMVEWKGTVLLEKMNFLDLSNVVARTQDKLSELVGARVNLQLVSVETDSGTGKGKRSDKAPLENWFSTPGIWEADNGTEYSVRFRVKRDFGLPGAILVENNHPNAFLLRSVRLESSNAKVEFVCNSWIYNLKTVVKPRIFFSTKTYLPALTPAGLKDLRLLELENLRGSGTGTRVDSDRIYDYDVYNDLGHPDKGPDFARPVLGGSAEFPYPRRCRTGRGRTRSDPKSEKTLGITGVIYIPRDEKFYRVKNSDFLGTAFKSFVHVVVPWIKVVLNFSLDFQSFEQINGFYSAVTYLRGAAREPTAEGLELIDDIADLPQRGDPKLFSFPKPEIIQASENHWSSDEEFSRQMLAGVNPIVIERLKVFPPVSNLDPNKYGSEVSAITAEHIERNLDGMTAEEALRTKKLYVLDHHDVYLPYIERINKRKNKGYASRTLLFLTSKGSLRPVAIELSLPPSSTNGTAQPVANNRVFVPPPPGQTDWLWNLAKAHAIINDVGVHELVSHWLRTHACMEPIIIATNRQLSSMHPVYNLLFPHFKDTMNINSIARNNLIGCFSGSLLDGGIVEYSFTPEKYSMELSSQVYKDWRLDEQALPGDLIKRGMAERDPAAPHGLKLLIEDYPYAVDGLEIWAALRAWAGEYVEVFYENDDAVTEDEELQEWWTDIRHKGHGDKATEEWWPELHSRRALAEVAATFMWVASCHHAALNFGQYVYGGYAPARPSNGRRLVPETKDDAELVRDPDRLFMKTMSSAGQSFIVMATLEILSTHAADEQYLGISTLRAEDFSAPTALREAQKRFAERMVEAEKSMQRRNRDPSLFNRRGVADIPYTLLFPTSRVGLYGRGVPSSTSI